MSSGSLRPPNERHAQKEEMLVALDEANFREDVRGLREANSERRYMAGERPNSGRQGGQRRPRVQGN